MLDKLLLQLARVLQQDNATVPSRVRFAPQLAYGRHEGPAAVDARLAAVLLLLYPREGEWRLPLTVRQSFLADHAGQVSLPGGMLDPGESSSGGAIRELSEELGIDLQPSQLLGALRPVYVFHSNFLVTPWLAHLPAPPAVRPNPAEVADLFELPLRTLMDPASYSQIVIRRGALQYCAPCICCSRHRIWGATSLILGEFCAALEAAMRTADSPVDGSADFP